MIDLDATDIRILAALQQEGDLTLEQLAERCHVSPSRCSRRVQRLRDEHYIRHIAAILDPQKLGLSIKAYITVVLLRHSEKAEAFHSLVRRAPEVLECSMITGDADFLLKVCTRDLKTFRVFLDDLAATNQVATIRSSIVIDEMKNTSALPLLR
jgi:DNA-binding Lrp family transcriptional regulator